MQKPVLIIAVGAILLAVGAYLSLGGKNSDPALTDRCLVELRSRGPEAAPLVAQCDDPAFARAITATNADEAARAIGAANQAEAGLSITAMFMLGLGLVLTAAGLLQLFARRRQAS